ncbi:hypothetical protein K435DRAFT_847002 [Dendrothele bispora CBS 962.96]|uniref:Uncharacterized protein n=2 Tax=Dendrothele bispora (strain CBS 962.96) TaxID=1314807 RepID=A0A4S8MXG7_DENBC|nr:hypothetical protein K435DRAFT_847002 [Dendrothele bispora CBS 962.96]
MDSLAEHEVYVLKNGRVLDFNDQPTTDVVTEGLKQLIGGNPSPLQEYNLSFKRLQRRNRVKPAIGEQMGSSKNSGQSSSGVGTQVLEGDEMELGEEDASSISDDEPEECFTSSLGEALDQEDGDMVGLEGAEDVALDMDLVEVTIEDGSDDGSDVE